MTNRKTVKLQSDSAKLAVASLAVSGIKVPPFGMELLKQREDGLISYDQARETVRLNALKVASDTNVAIPRELARKLGLLAPKDD